MNCVNIKRKDRANRLLSTITLERARLHDDQWVNNFAVVPSIGWSTSSETCRLAKEDESANLSAKWPIKVIVHPEAMGGCLRRVPSPTAHDAVRFQVLLDLGRYVAVFHVLVVPLPATPGKAAAKNTSSAVLREFAVEMSLPAIKSAAFYGAPFVRKWYRTHSAQTNAKSDRFS